MKKASPPELQNLNGVTASDALVYARQALSGKRIALIGFPEAAAAELTRIVTEAEGFTRSLSLEIHPSAEVLKPFELILTNVELAAGSVWLNREELSAVSERCVAVGQTPVLLMLATQSRLPYRECSVWPAAGGDLLLRCMLALQSGVNRGPRSAPPGSTVVLADDDPSVTSLVRLALQRNGMTCEVASNGGDALKLIEKLKPVAAVLDVGMPNIDGFEVLSRLRNNSEIAQTRVILLTGCEQESDILRGFSLGADDYVIKPFNPMELMMRLKRAIGRI